MMTALTAIKTAAKRMAVSGNHVSPVAAL